MRSSGIPARFEMGFSLPEGKTEGDISGYHCWAEFYLSGVGWVPVDASEAWKNPAKRDFFFGAHDTNRVFFTYGRDIRLSPEHKSDPLNYFIYPYAETNGQPVKNLQTHFSFRDVSAEQFAAAGRFKPLYCPPSAVLPPAEPPRANEGSWEISTLMSGRFVNVNSTTVSRPHFVH